MVDRNLESASSPDLRWNFSLVVANGVAFRLVDTLINPNLVLVVFLAQLTDNPVILGMPMAMWTGGFMLSQLWVSGRVQRRARVLPMYRALSLVRVLMWLVVVLAALYVTDPNTLIVIFLLFLLVYPLMWGISGLAFLEIVGKAIPPRLRGPVFSWRMTLGGFIALGGGWIVNRVLAESFPLAFPHNFALLFAMAAVATGLGLLVFHFVREPDAGPRAASPAGRRGRWQEIRAVWQGDSLFRHYVLARGSLLLAAGTSPLIIIFARQRFDLPLNASAIFLAADAATGLVVVASSGWFSARFGNQRLAMLAASLGVSVFSLIVLASLLNLSEHGAFLYFLAVFVLLAAYNSTSAISFIALHLNIPPADRRPLYIGLANTIFGTASYLTMTQGVIVTVIGYRGLFMMAVGMMLLGLWQVVVYLRDPAAEEYAGNG